MTNYSISFKIDDYNPKIKSISYKNFICLIIYEDFQLRIPITNNDYNISKHLLKNVKSDLYYKITIFEDTKKTLIGFNDFIIPYKILYKINSVELYIYKKEIKFIISKNTKIPFNKIENMFIKLSAKIYKIQKNRKTSKKPDSINKNYISQSITERASFIQKNRNLIKAKVVINKNKINKNKDEFLYSDSNKLISTNDLSGNLFNSYSNIDDNENNTNNYINNISTINNKNNQNYFCFNTTSGKEELKNNKYNIYKLDAKKNINKNNNYKKNEGNRLLQIRNKLKKRYDINNDTNFNNKNEYKKLSERNLNKNISIKNTITKSKTRNSFNNDLKKKYWNIIKSEEGSKSLRLYKNRIINLRNEENNTTNLCEEYSNRHYIKTEIKKIKNKSTIRAFINKNYKEKYKFISLNKDKNENLLNKKKKYLTEYLLNKALLSERLSLSQNIKNKNNSIFNSHKNIKIKRKKDNFSKNRNINNIQDLSLSKIKKSKNKIDTTNTNNKKYNKDILYISNNNIQIKVARKIKNKNNIKKDNCENSQKEIKMNNLKLSRYFILNNKNIKSIYLKLKENQKKLILIKELFFSLLKESNRLDEKKSFLFRNKFILYNIKNSINKNIKQPLKQIKRKEYKIYQRIFKFYDFQNEIPKFKSKEQILDEQIFKLQLCIIKNLIKHYGNISQIFTDDILQKEKLKKTLIKNNIIEKENKNNYIDLVSFNKINSSVKKIIKSTFNNDVNYKFNIIQEVQDEKESEKNSNIINKTNNISSINNDDISDEILFIDKKESDYNEDIINCNNIKTKNISNSINNFKNDYSNSIRENSNIKKEDKKNIRKNIRKELIGINKKRFKGKDLNFEEFGFDCSDNNKIQKKENLFKIGFFSKKKKDKKDEKLIEFI